MKLLRPVHKGQSLTWADVAMDTSTRAWKIRSQTETPFDEPSRKAA